MSGLVGAREVVGTTISAVNEDLLMQSCRSVVVGALVLAVVVLVPVPVVDMIWQRRLPGRPGDNMPVGRRELLESSAAAAAAVQEQDICRLLYSSEVLRLSGGGAVDGGEADEAVFEALAPPGRGILPPVPMWATGDERSWSLETETPANVR